MRVVVSDFLEAVDADDPSWAAPIRALAQRHQVLAVEVVDPRETELPDVGVLDLVDPETGHVVELDTGRVDVREEFAHHAEAHRTRVAGALRRAGCAHLVLRTDSDWVRDTARFVLAHRRMARHVHGETGARR
jgi:uncharacterized protein (DUF58 family)